MLVDRRQAELAAAAEAALPTLLGSHVCIMRARRRCLRWVTAGPHSAKTQLTLFIFVYSALAFGGAREQAVFSVRALRKNQKNQPVIVWNGVFCAKFAFDFFFVFNTETNRRHTQPSYTWLTLLLTREVINSNNNRKTIRNTPEHSSWRLLGTIAQGRTVVHSGSVFNEKFSKKSVKIQKSGWFEQWRLTAVSRFLQLCIVWLVNNSVWYASSWWTSRQVLPRGRNFSD